MKASFIPTALRALFLSQLCQFPLNAEEIDFSWWDPRYQNPGLLSQAGGGYSREARLPGQEDIVELTNDSSFKTNQALISILVLPKGSDVIGPDALTARAQTDFGKNHAQTQTLITGFGESSDKTYFDRRSHSMSAESIWSDRWTFSGPALGTASVTLSGSFDVDISNSPCTTGHCGQVGNPILDREGLNSWWYRIFGSIRVFDLDIIDEWIQPDSDFPLEVPREMASFEVFQQGSNIAADSFGSLGPYPNVPNKRLTPIHAAGTATFVPVRGHRYAIIGAISQPSANSLND